MTDQKKKPNKRTEEADEQDFTAVGVVFAVVGLAMVMGEATRATGIPFLILGFTFYIIGRRDAPPKDKK